MDNLFSYLLNRKPTQQEIEKYRGLTPQNINQHIISSQEYSNFMHNNYNIISEQICQIFLLTKNQYQQYLTDECRQKLYHIWRENQYNLVKLKRLLVSLKQEFDFMLEKKFKNFYSSLTNLFPEFSKIYLTMLNETICDNKTMILVVDKCFQELTWDIQFINFVDNYTDKYLC